jgi:hypothetical protein
MLRNDFEDHREEQGAKIAYFEDEFPLKAYKSDVLDQENKLMANFRDILDQLADKMCKKDEYNRKLL